MAAPNPVAVDPNPVAVDPIPVAVDPIPDPAADPSPDRPAVDPGNGGDALARGSARPTHTITAPKIV